MGSAEQLGDLGEWFARQLAHLFWRTKNAPAGHSTTLRVGQDRIQWEEGIPAPDARLRPSAIVFEQGQYLRRRLADQRLPYSRALEIASIDLVQHTPFALSDVALIPYYEQNETGTFYCVLKKRTVDLCSEALSDRGGDLGAVYIMVDGERKALRRRAHSVFTRKRSLLHHIRCLAHAFLVLGVLITVGHLYLKLDQARSEVVAQRDEMQTRAKAARQIIDQRSKAVASLDSVRRMKSDRISVSTIWGELSRILPDEAWLTDLSVRGNAVSVSGFAAQTASLVAPLDASAIFSRPAFVGATTRLPGHSGEHFEMRMDIERP